MSKNSKNQVLVNSCGSHYMYANSIRKDPSLMKMTGILPIPASLWVYSKTPVKAGDTFQ